MDEKKYYSLAEVGRLLGISRIAVFRKVKRGEIDAVRIGRSWAVPARALDYLLGRALGEKAAKEIDAAVRRVVDEYGEVLERLGRE
jgi:excisionase family DNA binding protein